MPESFQDIREYYAVLQLSPGVSLEEVEQAYQAREEEWRQDRNFPRFQIQEAYRFLSDPGNKSAYDALRGPEIKPLLKTRTMMLGGILMFLFVIAGFVFPGFLLEDPEPFLVGDVLVHSRNEGILGTVLMLESSHRFRHAVIEEAYLVESPAGEQRWYPTGELERYYHRQPVETATSVLMGDDPQQ
jgi:curved DNA-binding protein CbpA